MSTAMSDDLFDWIESRRRTRTDQLLDAFIAFHENHPGVWVLFQRFALDARRAGRKNYSSNAIFERIRWHIDQHQNNHEMPIPSLHQRA